MQHLKLLLVAILVTACTYNVNGYTVPIKRRPTNLMNIGDGAPRAATPSIYVSISAPDFGTTLPEVPASNVRAKENSLRTTLDTVPKRVRFATHGIENPDQFVNNMAATAIGQAELNPTLKKATDTVRTFSSVLSAVQNPERLVTDLAMSAPGVGPTLEKVQTFSRVIQDPEKLVNSVASAGVDLIKTAPRGDSTLKKARTLSGDVRDLDTSRNAAGFAGSVRLLDQAKDTAGGLLKRSASFADVGTKMVGSVPGIPGVLRHAATISEGVEAAKKSAFGRCTLPSKAFVNSYLTSGLRYFQENKGRLVTALARFMNADDLFKTLHIAQAGNSVLAPNEFVSKIIVSNSEVGGLNAPISNLVMRAMMSRLTACMESASPQTKIAIRMADVVWRAFSNLRKIRELKAEDALMEAIDAIFKDDIDPIIKRKILKIAPNVGIIAHPTTGPKLKFRSAQHIASVLLDMKTADGLLGTAASFFGLGMPYEMVRGVIFDTANFAEDYVATEIKTASEALERIQSKLNQLKRSNTM